MDVLERPDPLLVGSVALAIIAFAAREVAAGLFRAIGGDLWGWLKRRPVR